MAEKTTGSIQYHEPNAILLLVLISFLLLLSVSHRIAQYIFKAGLIGQLALGIIYGAPLANILPLDWQTTFTSLGYLGLLLLIFEGGLETNLKLLSRNLLLSFLCAVTGVGVPIGFTMALLVPDGFGGFEVLESFAIGAALAATSLGTTLSLLSGYRVKAKTVDTEDTAVENEDEVERQGMEPQGVKRQEVKRNDSKVIAKVEEGEVFGLLESRVGIVLLSAALIDDIIALVMSAVISNLGEEGSGTLSGWIIARPIVSSVLIILLTPPVAIFIARPLCRLLPLSRLKKERHVHFAVLLGMAAVISAFLAIAYWSGSSMLLGAFMAGVFVNLARSNPDSDRDDQATIPINPMQVYHLFVSPITKILLTPLFFASIGFSIPFLDMWRGEIVWKGIVYSILMGIGKLIVGVWIIFWNMINPPKTNSSTRTSAWHNMDAALLLGCGMIARGEIGLLIAQLGYNGGILSKDGFLICVWAILLNTLIGPMAVGFVVQRFRNRILRGNWGLAGLSKDLPSQA